MAPVTPFEPVQCHDLAVFVFFFEPVRRETMTKRAIVFGQGRVRRAAKEDVAEGERADGGDGRLFGSGNRLVLDERVEDRLERRGLFPDQRAHPFAGEHLAIDARRAEHLARNGVEALEAHLCHCDDSLGESVPI